MQLNLFLENSKFTIEDIFEAYFKCRKNKRNTYNALNFELDYENNLIKLFTEINNGTYQPVKSIAFIVDKPVKREIFASDFKDRVVHHLLINKLNTLFEKEFINDSYACRKGKGTHFGIKRINKFIRSCSNGYTKDCYILKLDIKAFFMSIDKNILFKILEIFIKEKYKNSDLNLVLDLTKKITYSDPTKNCIIKGNKKNWIGLPRDKSLFYSKQNCGLPIGNLSSQVFANFYLNHFDHFLKSKFKYYGRYVDDFIIVHENKDYLKNVIFEIKNYLYKNLDLNLHPKKIYLQHYKKGVKFLGVIIKPYRIYTAKRTKNNFIESILNLNGLVKNNKPSKHDKIKFLSVVNSYLGIMKHYKTYKLKKYILIKYLNSKWWSLISLGKFNTKIKLKIIIDT